MRFLRCEAADLGGPISLRLFNLHEGSFVSYFLPGYFAMSQLAGQTHHVSCKIRINISITQNNGFCPRNILGELSESAFNSSREGVSEMRYIISAHSLFRHPFRHSKLEYEALVVDYPGHRDRPSGLASRGWKNPFPKL